VAQTNEVAHLFHLCVGHPEVCDELEAGRAAAAAALEPV
jgi:hypothetical protein